MTPTLRMHHRTMTRLQFVRSRRTAGLLRRIAEREGAR